MKISDIELWCDLQALLKYMQGNEAKECNEIINILNIIFNPEKSLEDAQSAIKALVDGKPSYTLHEACFLVLCNVYNLYSTDVKPYFDVLKNNNYPPALYTLHFLATSKEEQRELLNKAAQYNYSPALYVLGCDHLNEGRLQDAVNCFFRASAVDHLLAQFQLGYCYYSSSRVLPPDVPPECLPIDNIRLGDPTSEVMAAFLQFMQVYQHLESSGFVFEKNSFFEKTIYHLEQCFVKFQYGHPSDYLKPLSKDKVIQLWDTTNKLSTLCLHAPYFISTICQSLEPNFSDTDPFIDSALFALNNRLMSTRPRNIRQRIRSLAEDLHPKIIHYMATKISPECSIGLSLPSVDEHISMIEDPTHALWHTYLPSLMPHKIPENEPQVLPTAEYKKDDEAYRVNLRKLDAAFELRRHAECAVLKPATPSRQNNLSAAVVPSAGAGAAVPSAGVGAGAENPVPGHVTFAWGRGRSLVAHIATAADIRYTAMKAIRPRCYAKVGAGPGPGANNTRQNV